MLLKNTFIFKEIGEEGMLIPIVGGNVNASKIFNLNETGTYIIKKLLDDYENARFIREDGSLDNTSCNTRQYMVIRKMGFLLGDNQQKVMDMNIYPMIFQGACSHTKTIRKTDKTFWIHYENMSWL